MKKNFLAALFVSILVSLSFANDAFAGAWTVPKYKVWAEYYTKIGYAKEYFNPSGNLKSVPLSGSKSFRDQVLTMEPKIEFGITDWLTALASIESKEAQYKEYGVPLHVGYLPEEQYTVKNHGISNVKVGGRWRIMDAPFVLSTQTKVFIYPGYPINPNKGWVQINDFEYAEDRTHLPPIGKGDTDVEQRILVGKTFSIPINEKFKLPCYFGAETGYRWRSKNVCDDIPYFLEGGFWPVPWFLVKSEIDGYLCAPGTGNIKESYGIWRIGGVWQVFGGDSVLRQGSKMFNIELQYGMTLWGKNTSAYQEFIVKAQTQF